MSTRGWNEYYIIEEKTNQIFLSMQFYKWGDAVPENAIIELLNFREIINECSGEISLALLDKMLKDQLREAYHQLPKSFSIGCYLFFLQRALEEMSPWKQIELRGIPEKQRPDYQLGYELGKQSVKENYPLLKHKNKFITLVNDFIAVGALLRKWEDYNLKLDFLTWIQYLTQLTKEVDMGSIVGSYEASSDISYLYRFFFFVPELSLNQKIKNIKIQFCDSSGNDLLESLKEDIKNEDIEEEKKYLIERLVELEKDIEKEKIDIFSLDEALKSYNMQVSLFWK